MTNTNQIINQLYLDIEKNKMNSDLDSESKTLFTHFNQKINPSIQFSNLSHEDFFKLLIVHFYHQCMNPTLIEEFTNRFHQNFNQIEAFVKEHPFITFYCISQAFILNQNNTNIKTTKKLNSLLQHFCYLNQFDDLINFFPEKETPLLDTIQFNQDDNLNIAIYESSPLLFLQTIFEHYGLNIKTQYGNDIWLIASQFCRLDMCQWLEKEGIAYTKNNTQNHSPFVILMNEFHIYTNNYVEVYDFLFEQDKKHIINYQDEHIWLMKEQMKYGNIPGIEYLIHKNFDFSYPNFATYLDILEDDSKRSHIAGRTQEEFNDIKNYLKKLRLVIVEKEQEQIVSELNNLETKESKKIKV